MNPVVKALTTTGLAVSFIAATAAPAAAAPMSGMVLQCSDGRTLTRSNGASWWGLAADGSPNGTVYVTTHLRVTDLDNNLIFEKLYGADRAPTTDVCVAQHGPFPEEDFPGTHWTVVLTRTA